ncbi:hypothetical protein BASA81_010271 [Batrachochytrium salamandrivorans]|nr:hypothetical protein BASA81_010271 [Batrachochytrium salamandrivorans]
MSFEENTVAARVGRGYENEFGLVTSSAVLSIVSFGLLITCVMPNLAWAYVATTTGLETFVDPSTNLTSQYFPVTIESFSLWDFSCSTPGMEFTYGLALCNTRYQAVEAFSTMACVFSILGLVFGIMPLSPAAPREPKQALTHSMLSHLLSGLFALVSWAVFYGGLVFGVWQSPSQAITQSGVQWENSVVVTSGGILAVSGWAGAFVAWLLSLSAMIKYDAGAAEQAILAHRQRKEKRARKKAEIVQRLGEGAFRAAHDKESIPLEMGDRLYVGGTIVGGGTAAIAWGNMSLVPYLFMSPFALPAVAGVFQICIAVSATTGAIVLLVGLADLVPRPKASVGGFAVFSAVTVAWCCTFGMAIHFITTFSQQVNTGMLALEAAVGSLGIAAALSTTSVLFHPFRIWEKDFTELPRPAKIHKGENGLALVITSAASCLLAFCLCMAAITVFTINEQDFVASSPDTIPTGAPTSNSGCPNTQGDVCNLGTEQERCCQAPFECIEVAFTKFTCQYVDPGNRLVGIRDAFTVGQAFLGLTIGFSSVAYVFAALALCPNGAIDIKAALSVTACTGLCAFVCCVVSFSVLQGYVLSNGGVGMPIECGYLLGSFCVQALGAVFALCALREYHDQTKISYAHIQDDLLRAQRELELEQVKLDIVQTKQQRLALERQLNQNGGEDDEEESEDEEQVPITASELQVV